MPNDLLAAADLVTINNKNAVDIDFGDVLNQAPLMKALASIPASNGSTHYHLKESGAPTVGFRSANDGRLYDHSDDTLVTTTCKILDASFRVDKAIADGYQKGGPEALIAREAKRHLRAAFFKAEQQILQGTGLDAAGFSGLPNSTALDATTDTMVVDAGGAGTGGGSSVWLIRGAEDGLAVVYGDEGNFEMGETTVIEASGSATGTFPAYYTPFTGYVGLQFATVYDVARIVNLDDADSGEMLTDDMIYEALSLFPTSRQPNLIVMSRRSLRQLRQSRTATNALGTPAPRPTEVDGIPIIASDGVSDAEDAVS